MTKVKAISPLSVKDKVEKEKINKIESEMIQAFNELIKEKYIDGYFKIYQNEVEKRYLKIKGLKGREGEKEMKRVIDLGLMDIEPLYKSQGWDVKYDTAGWDTPDEPYFLFKEKK